MSNYDFLSSLEPIIFKKLITTNVIRPTVEKEMKVFAYFNNIAPRVGRMQARMDTADKFCTSEETIKRIIKRLS